MKEELEDIQKLKELKVLFEELYLQLSKEEKNDRKSKTGYFDFFEEHILKQERFKIYKTAKVGSRTIKNYYEKYVNGKKGSGSGTPTYELKELITIYLGYENFIDFKIKNKEVIAKTVPPIPPETEKGVTKITTTEKPKTNNEASNTSIQKTEKNDRNYFSWINNDGNTNKRTVAIASGFTFLLISFFLIYYKDAFFSSNDCIIWNGTQYEKSPCYLINTIDNNKYQIDITSFRKVKLTEDTPFFKDGQPNIWYANYNRVREFFNTSGIHPKTKKPLKEITRDILASEGFSE